MDHCSSAAEISCPFDAAALDELREILDGGEAITEVEQSPWPEQGRLGLQKPGHFVEQIGVAQRRVRMTLRLMKMISSVRPSFSSATSRHAENTSVSKALSLAGSITNSIFAIADFTSADSQGDASYSQGVNRPRRSAIAMT